MSLPKYVNMNRASERQQFALKMFVDHGITAFRMSKDGQVAWIKDANLGWMSADRWAMIGRVKEVLASPLIERIIEGGYELNSTLLATIGGKVLYAGAVGALMIAISQQDWQTVLLLMAGLLAPFGSLVLLYLFAEEVGDAKEFLKTRGSPLSSDLGSLGGVKPEDQKHGPPGSAIVWFFETLGAAAQGRLPPPRPDVDYGPPPPA